MQVSGMAGLASLQQMQQMRQNMFSKADTDNDGGLSIGEFSAAGRSKSSGSANSADQARAEKMFAAADSDSDGKLTENELDTYFTKLESRTQSQLLQFQQSAADRAAGFLGKADTDSDGSLSLDEFAAAGPGGASDTDRAALAEELFARIDGDSDGKLTESELSTFDKSRGPGGAGDMPPPPPPPGMSASDTDEESGTTLADLLASSAEGDDADSAASTDFASQIQTYLQRLLSSYASQAKSDTSTISVSA